MATIYSFIILILNIGASVFDAETALYFSTTLKECVELTNNGFTQNGCFCQQTARAFDDLFQYIGAIKCDNMVSRNPMLLISNVFMTMATVVLAWVMFQWYCRRFIESVGQSLCGPSRGNHHQVNDEYTTDSLLT